MTTTTQLPTIGSIAPDFSLSSTAGDTVKLSDMRGAAHVLLAFFPLAFTSTCTSELCAFSDDYDAFSGADVTVLPISVDAVPSLKAFKAQHNMKVELLSDFKREASKAYGVLRDDTYFSNRAYFLIDKSGVVRWAHVEDTPGTLRTNEEIMAVVREQLQGA